MTTPVRVLAFLAALAAVFAIAVGVGSAVGPIDEPEPATHAGDEHDDEGTGHGDGNAEQVGLPGGLAVSEDGYTLRLAQTTADAGARQRVEFHVEGPDGAPVTAYDVDHGKRLHLIAVRRDVTGYQHVHPVLADDGRWVATLDLSAGAWRLFADFNPTGGVGTTLGADLSVAGDFQPAPDVADTRTARVGDYTVTLAGELEPGTAAELTISVSRDGRPVTDLQPYLGSYGHLVALREGDLAYLHVHPEGSPDDGTTAPGPDVRFVAEVPSSARYRLFFDFRHDGVVRTAELVLTSHDAPEEGH